MIVLVKAQGKWGSFCFVGEDGKEFFAKPTSKVVTPFILGSYYDIELWQPEGKKSVYVSKAVAVEPKTPIVVTQQTTKPAQVLGNTKSVAKSFPSAGQPNYPDGKMSKEEWAKKDEGIKWLACVKASAEFNSHRPNVDVTKLLSDAKAIFSYDYVQSKSVAINDTVVQEEIEEIENEDVFNDNGL